MDRGQWDCSQNPGPGQCGDPWPHGDSGDNSEWTQRVEGGSGSVPKLTLAITVCPLTHLPMGTSPSHSLEPDCHQGSGYWGKVDFDRCLRTVPFQKGSDAT